MSNLWIHPALILIFGGLLLPLVPARLKKGWGHLTLQDGFELGAAVLLLEFGEPLERFEAQLNGKVKACLKHLMDGKPW